MSHSHCVVCKIDRDDRDLSPLGLCRPCKDSAAPECLCGRKDCPNEVEHARLPGAPSCGKCGHIAHGEERCTYRLCAMGEPPRQCACLCPAQPEGRVGRNGLRDSGKREQHATGAVRDSAVGKGRPDLISPFMLQQLAAHLEQGAQKYEERNWEKGIPLCRSYASLTRHAWLWFLGYTDENHMAAVICNAMFIIHTMEMIKRKRLPRDLDDRPECGRLDGVRCAKLDCRCAPEELVGGRCQYYA